MKQVKEMKRLVPVFVPEYPYAYFLLQAAIQDTTNHFCIATPPITIL